MSYEFYKILHLTGIFMVLIPLGGLAVHTINGGTKDHSWRKPLGMVHGIGLLVTLVAGFGLVARLGTGFQGWVIAKLFIWLFFGGVLGVLYKKPEKAKAVWWSLFVMSAMATTLAVLKPF